MCAYTRTLKCCLLLDHVLDELVVVLDALLLRYKVDIGDEIRLRGLSGGV